METIPEEKKELSKEEIEFIKSKVKELGKDKFIELKNKFVNEIGEEYSISEEDNTALVNDFNNYDDAYMLPLPVGFFIRNKDKIKNVENFNKIAPSLKIQLDSLVNDKLTNYFLTLKNIQ